MPSPPARARTPAAKPWYIAPDRRGAEEAPSRQFFCESLDGTQCKHPTFVRKQSKVVTDPDHLTTDLI